MNLYEQEEKNAKARDYDKSMDVFEQSVILQNVMIVTKLHM